MFIDSDRSVILRAVLVSLICWIGIIWGALRLQTEMSQSGAAGTGPVYATIEETVERVRRKPGTSYIWSNVGESESLYLKDSVQTGSDSSARIRLEDGTVLELGEQTLIVLDATAEMPLQFLQGEAILRGTSGDSKISAAQDGKVKVEQLPVKLITPDPRASLFVANTQGPKAQGITSRPVDFRWELSDANLSSQRLTLQLSADPRFKGSSVREFKIKDGAVRIPLAPGAYYWRIKSPERVASEVRSFYLAAAEPLTPVAPLTGTELSFWGKASTTEFRWSAPESSKLPGVQHEIQISRDASFSQLIETSKVLPSHGIASINSLPEGELFWRLRSRYGDLELRTPPQSFRLKTATRAELTLLSPDPGAISPGGKELRFTWSGKPEGSDYVWQIQRKGAEASEPESSRPIRAFVQNWKPGADGQYQWRVLAVYDGKVVGESAWRGINITSNAPLQLLAPADEARILAWKDPPPFTFRWKKDEVSRAGGNQYEVQLSPTKDFSKITASGKSQGDSLLSSSIRIAHGEHFWRVRLVSAEGEVLRSSEPRRLQYGNRPALRAPASALPEPEYSFDLVRLNSPATLSWEAVPEAKAYQVTLRKAGTKNSKPLFIKQVQTTELKLPKLAPGRYEWTVQAIDPMNRPGETLAPRAFAMEVGAPLSAPKILTPEVQ